MPLSSALASSNSVPEAESEPTSSQSPTTSGSPVTPPRYPTAHLSSATRKLRPTSPRAQRLETFEDLLKEAGYSHTRVITPKAERLAKDAATYSSHTRDDSHDKDGANGADSAFTGAARYAARMANFLSWVAGSTTAAATEREDRQEVTVEDWKLRRNDERNPSPTPRRALASHNSQDGQAHSSSSRHLQPNPKSAFPELASLEYISPSPSSDTLMTSSTSTSTMTVRPTVQAPSHTNQPPLRHAVPSPPHHSPSPGTIGSNTPNNVTSAHAMQNSRRSTNARASRPTRRSPLPEAWQQPNHTRSPRRRCPSEKLLARTSSLTLSTSSAAAAATRRAHLQAMTSPVTVSCRSSSVGATTRHKKRKELPLLAPSAETGAWPWTTDATGNNQNGNGKQGRFSPLPKINVHAANGTARRPLARTASGTSARGYSSLSRNGSGYASFSRGSISGYTSISRTSGMTSSSRGGEEVSWADYSYRNSPVVSGFKNLPHPHAVVDNEEPTDEGDDDSEDEPHLSNILAPHISPLDVTPRPSNQNPGPVERQRSIQSLRACLRRHESSTGPSRISSPHAASFPVEQIPPVPVLSLPKPGGNFHADGEAQNLPKRRSVGHFDQHRHGHGQGKRVEGDAPETTERGRSDSRLARLGGLNWSANAANAHSSRSPSNGVKGPRTSSTPARVGKKDDKLSKKELERERLLWGTSWGRK